MASYDVASKMSLAHIALHVIQRSFNPRLLSHMTPYVVESDIRVPDIAHHVIQRTRLWSDMTPYDVASNMSWALPPGCGA
jgi:hypothetical protein